MGLALTIPENDGHVALRDAEKLAYLGLAHGAFQSPDFGDFIAGQKFLEHSDASYVDGVLPVARVINPFEVGHDAIRFDAILVIDHRQIVGIGDECECNESVQKECLPAPVSPHAALLVTQFIDARSDYFSVASLQATGPHAHSIKTSYASEIANFVEVFETGDRNGSPFFCGDDIHEAGRPSGVFGLAVKNPSRAPTFGGFAIMAAHSDTYNGRLYCRSH